MSYHGLMAHQRSKGRMPSSMNSKIRQQQDMLGNDESDDNEGELWLEVRITEAETAADYSDKSQQVKKGYKPRGKSGLESNQKDFNRGVHNLTMAETAADYSDKSQQVCDCGWSKWTTDRGLRTHQVKKGCKPRGKRYEGSQQQDVLGNDESDDNEGELWLEVNNTEAETAADYSDKSQQVKKGYKPRGKRYEGSQQQDMLGKSGLESNQKDFNRGVHNLTMAETAADYSDKSQQVCDCGWSKWTTDRGLRTHQVKKGCKPRGKRYEGSQQQDMLGNDESDDSEGELWLEVNNTEAETAADYSDKSQQVCDCGWSKWTTDRGLRTHQVKKGCKPRGKSGLKTNQKDDRLDVHNLATDEQVCFCGWSKWTTYHGLRTHQGLKGCTPKGLKIPQSDQHFWKTQWKAMHPQRMTFRKEL
ncbi:uncharacterized protein [Labrus bergylta]|uniref:uncharacterized protein isoform X2 n=1 Tax=Labrus bergylta TaxID=56723 RepID=UPI003313C605